MCFNEGTTIISLFLVRLELLNTDTSKCIASGDLLKNQRYEFGPVLFHWGSNNIVGSEHTINGDRYET